jgi:predicted O-methyltransferase YrrM
MWLRSTLMTTGRFRRIKRRTGGMIHSRTYRRIYREALRAPAGHFLEIGAGSGTATVCLALALAHRGSPHRVYTIEKFEGGSREQIGGRPENLALLQSNLAAYGVAERVRILDLRLSRDEDPAAYRALVEPPLALLFLDADGEVWRDFRIFYDCLVPGAPIIVDDYPARQPDPAQDPRTPRLRKQLATRAQLDHLVRRGLFEPRRQSVDTIFGVKPEAIRAPVAFDPAEIEALRQRRQPSGPSAA